MEVQLTDDQKALLRQGIESGRYRSEEDALRDALSLWEERERCAAEIRPDLEIAEVQAARGEGRWINSREESSRLVQEIHERGMAKLAAEATNR